MYLTRLIYASSVTHSLTDVDINNILSGARKNNREHNVTGMLCFDSYSFLQCLEGSRENVNKIYNVIAGDRRHSKLEIIDYKEIDKREFTNWSMGYIPSASMSNSLILKFSGSSKFNPYEMNGDSAYKMLLALKESLPSV
jgi:hypothetical protein